MFARSVTKSVTKTIARPGVAIPSTAMGFQRSLHSSVVTRDEVDEIQSHPFPGAQTPFTYSLEFRNETDLFDTYRVMNERGEVINEDQDPNLDEETAVKMYKTMISLNTMDNVLYEAQRQGRVSFYMTAFGEEATHMGSAAALTLDDVIYGQYREAGVLMYRGFTLENFMDQCFGSKDDPGKGRQMPVHYGSKELNFQTISSPLATQLPQAAGLGYALRLEDTDAACVCYFGEGAASEGDFHAALNFASTVGSRTIFFCRNNGYAISTPSTEQYRGDGIASRGFGYGMHTIRVDGNDVFAVYNATKEARRLAVEENKPTLIECMTYRGGHHSTSDDASRYRSKSEVDYWITDGSPITRLGRYLNNKGWWSQEQDEELRAALRKEVLSTMEKVESKLQPPLSSLFVDVYDNVPKHLKEQQQSMLEHIAKYPDYYHTTNLEQEK
eukprot:TRINITY_DN3768_c0_g2_i1.p1 TRINITY_DN3768_c0_g2~~TRINITY_DN3768_c0_g2_i1.p1  ORF type:complete len:442 (+),score=121.75 TRINITY_DN3768_c0_g2_i1:157-1482(+)